MKRIDSHAFIHDTYLYVMVSDGHAKIGYSDNPEKRRSSLQGGNPKNIDLVHKVKLWGFVHIIESSLHEKYDKYHKRGEWFEVDINTLANILYDFDALEMIEIYLQDIFRYGIRDFENTKQDTFVDFLEKAAEVLDGAEK